HADGDDEQCSSSQQRASQPTPQVQHPTQDSATHKPKRYRKYRQGPNPNPYFLLASRCVEGHHGSHQCERRHDGSADPASDRKHNEYWPVDNHVYQPPQVSTAHFLPHLYSFDQTTAECDHLTPWSGHGLPVSSASLASARALIGGWHMTGCCCGGWQAVQARALIGADTPDRRGAVRRAVGGGALAPGPR